LSVTRAETAEVVVIGAGPGGASAARLLSSLGHRVTVLTRPAARPALAESIPPSATKLLAHLGWDALVDRAGFIRSTGNTVLWGSGGAVGGGRDGIRETYYAEGAEGRQLGYQVDRGVLNELLLDDVRRTQCRVLDDVTVTGVRDGVITYADAAGEQTMRADWVLDCSGRGAVVGRAGWRQAIPLQRTLAIAALWERAGSWPLPDATHTIVESHADGWAWSVPLSMTRRHVTVMIDPGLTKLGAHADLRDAYASELSRVPGLSSLTREATLLAEPFARDASAYRCTRVCGPGLVLVGDAASFVDPLSSFGIKKALASAWLGAVVVHSCLIDAAMTQPALALFESREAAMFDALDRARVELAQSALDHGAASAFWAARALPGSGDSAPPNEDPDGALLRDDPDVRAAFDELKRRESITFAANATLEWVQQPTVQDNRVVLESRLSLPAYPRGIRYVRSIDLAKVVDLAPKVSQVPDLYELYCRSVAPVPLADFLGVLSFLVGKRVLVFA
jgi:FAD-dependent halogenase